MPPGRARAAVSAPSPRGGKPDAFHAPQTRPHPSGGPQAQREEAAVAPKSQEVTVTHRVPPSVRLKTAPLTGEATAVPSRTESRVSPCGLGRALGVGRDSGHSRRAARRRRPRGASTVLSLRGSGVFSVAAGSPAWGDAFYFGRKGERDRPLTPTEDTSRAGTALLTTPPPAPPPGPASGAEELPSHVERRRRDFSCETGVGKGTGGRGRQNRGAAVPGVSSGESSRRRDNWRHGDFVPSRLGCGDRGLPHRRRLWKDHLVRRHGRRPSRPRRASAGMETPAVRGGGPLQPH